MVPPSTYRTCPGLRGGRRRRRCPGLSPSRRRYQRLLPRRSLTGSPVPALAPLPALGEEVEVDVLLGVGFDDFLVKLDAEAWTWGGSSSVCYFGRGLGASRGPRGLRSLKYSWMRKFVVQAARWSAAAVLIWRRRCAGAVVT